MLFCLGTPDEMAKAFDMIFKMIAEDPQSSSCPNISYADYKGPVANANPTGSPFAGAGAASSQMEMGGFMGGKQHSVGGMYPNFGGGAGSGFPGIENVKTTLRNTGYSVQASEEITAALCTLANYGLLGFGGGFGNPMGGGGGSSLDYLSQLLGTGKGREGGAYNPGVSGQLMGADKGGYMGGLDQSGFYSSSGRNDNSFGGSGGFGNQNSFGLGTSITPASGGGGETVSKELEIGENIVGAVLGRGGGAVVEIQKATSAMIQISKKGVFAPGTRNRVATITGSASAVERAMFMVQQCIQQEESKRTRQELMLK